MGLLMTTAGCGMLPKEAADAQSQQGAEGRQGPPPVDVAIARIDNLREEPEYTGTTAPVQEVSLRSQVEGQVLSLTVDVGDAVKQGQRIGQLNDNLLKASLNQAEAELASLKAEVASAQNQVSNARAAVEQARLEQQQAQADSQRLQTLAQQGAIAVQQAEQAQTTARTAAQAVRAAQEQVRTQQQAVTAAQSRVTAQQAVVTQAREQLSYARLESPIAGVVTQRLTEQGNLVQPNGEIIRLGDFSQVKVGVEVSELELAKIRRGQSVTVHLDAFPNQTFKGQVTRISPAADQTARLVPVEVVIPNSNEQVGSGLLARVSFESEAAQRIVVPQSAVSQVGQGEQGKQGVVFVVTGGEGETPVAVTARSVTLGERADGQVEILSGLKAGERFVTRSGRPLKNGEPVRLSILSEQPQGGQQ
ncbi:efflux RND transporter periplasmic adaptor subunit [Chroococcidiopsis sp. CCMEE 29]|uniref:efflux RND transporter periplasmic adaptor subunit n=1 Tax=Chroococcidiopsis sp. CCMEE 29 TaxID=155894 RepID=UPI0031F8BA1B